MFIIFLTKLTIKSRRIGLREPEQNDFNRLGHLNFVDISDDNTDTSSEDTTEILERPFDDDDDRPPRNVPLLDPLLRDIDDW